MPVVINVSHGAASPASSVTVTNEVASSEILTPQQIYEKVRGAGADARLRHWCQKMIEEPGQAHGSLRIIAVGCS
jgi:hypothetical protein